MNYYTSTIPLPLAEKLKEKGMPMMSCFDITQTGSFSDDNGIHFYYLPTFGACFDWLMEKDVYIRIEPFLNRVNVRYWSWYINQDDEPDIESDFYFDFWHEAANAAIEKALTLI